MAATKVCSSDELWKDIPGYEGYYKISNQGRVKSLERVFVSGKGLVQRYPDRILKNRTYTTGYEYVGLCVNAVVKKFKVHRLVALAFIPNPDNKPQVDHLNAVRNDNRACNLRWATSSENQSNNFTVYRRSRSKSGMQNPMKAKRQAILQIDNNTKEIIAEWLGIKETAQILGFQSSGIARCCAGKAKTAHGFIWRYAD